MTATTEPAEPNDWQLAGLARTGDEGAFAALIERHQRAIHSFVHRHVADVETARDITQEVFVRAWFALDRVRPTARFTTWLFQIAVNLCRDHAKSRTARQDRLTDPIITHTTDLRERERNLPSCSTAPDQAAQSAEALVAFESEIARLPVDLREAFLLGAVEGRAHKEIAVMLRISPKAVEARIYRARRILGERLTRQGHLDLGG